MQTCAARVHARQARAEALRNSCGTRCSPERAAIPCPLCLPQYGLVFDAGSTHTALYIYRWPADKENGTGIVSQVEACTVSGECAGTCPSLSPSLLDRCPRLLQLHR